MTDAEKEIREALAAGPTPGPWCIYPETDGTEICAVDLVPGLPIRQVIAHPKHGANWIANARLIAACSPANVRELLAAHDALKADAERLASLAWPEPFCDEYNGIDLHEQASIYASALGREEPNRDDYLAALRCAIDAARGNE